MSTSTTSTHYGNNHDGIDLRNNDYNEKIHNFIDIEPHKYDKNICQKCETKLKPPATVSPPLQNNRLQKLCRRSLHTNIRDITR